MGIHILVLLMVVVISSSTPVHYQYTYVPQHKVVDKNMP